MKSFVVSLKGRRAHALYLQHKCSHIYSPGKKSWEQRQNRSFDFNLATISASHVHISALFIHYMLQPSYLTRLATCISDIANFSAK